MNLSEYSQNSMECKSFLTPSSSRGSETTLDIIQEFELSPLDEESNKDILKLKEKKSWKSARRSVVTHGTASWRGPLRALRLLILVALLPALLIAVPLYLRYYVFSGQLYPVGMSDMRIIDNKVSTTWCQRQLLHSNATFNAFLMATKPAIARDLVPVSMSRELILEDDMKEYWGFYLLQGSSVTVSTCVRWPGASLIMIRGHKHLQECAYIGDDSSEELEEILRANGGRLDNATIQKLLADQPTNRPADMTRHLKEVTFHEPRAPALQLNAADQVHTGHSDEKETPDSQMLKNILSQLKFKQETKKKAPRVRPSYIIPVPELVNRYRETNINEEEGKWLYFKDLDKTEKDQSMLIEDEKNILKAESEKLKVLNKSLNDNIIVNQNMTTSKYNSTDDEIGILSQAIAEEEADKLSSTEIFEDIFKKLNSLGARGRTVLERLNQKLSTQEIIENGNQSSRNASFGNNTLKYETSVEGQSEEEVADKKIETLRNLLEEIMEEQKKNKKDKKRKRKNDPAQKIKREIILEQALQKELNEEDEKGNLAMEEGFEADGIADHHARLNETTLNDMSHSEFWSSFSSSEEALLECDGLILNLPLTPHKSCEASETSFINHDTVSRANTVTYRVPTNGYYFFVFNSENEVQTNYIRVRFDMQKTIYDLSKGTIMECKNSTDRCEIPLGFFSEEKVVFEVPLRDNDSLWNEEFVVISECEPRTSLYIVCVILVPLLVVVMAFH